LKENKYNHKEIQYLIIRILQPLPYAGRRRERLAYFIETNGIFLHWIQIDGTNETAWKN
jgi:hypothetical protein